MTLSKTLSGLKFMQRAAEQKKFIDKEQAKEKVHAQEEEKPESGNDAQPRPDAPGPSLSHGPQSTRCKISYERAPIYSGTGRFSIGQRKEKVDEVGGGRREEDSEEPRPDTSTEVKQKKRGGKVEAPSVEVSDAEMAAMAFQRGPQKRQKV